MGNKKQKNLMKDTLSLGIGSMAGMGAMGAMAGIPGMPNTGVPGTVGVGLGLLNIGQMSKNAMSLVPETVARHRHGKKKRR